MIGGTISVITIAMGWLVRIKAMVHRVAVLRKNQ
jgi:hypothetical protein